MASLDHLRQKLRLSPLKYLPKGHLLASAFVAAGVIALSLGDSAPEAPRQIVESTQIPGLLLSGSESPATPVTLPKLDDLIAASEPVPAVEKAPVEPVEPPSPWKEFTVQTGDNLSVLFKRAGLNDRAIYELFADAKDAKDLRKIRPGQKMSFLVENGKLQQLDYKIDELNSLNFTRATKGFVSKQTALTPDVKVAFREAHIDSSLYMAGKRAGLPSNLTMELANIFGWDIDFALDIKKGDSFRVLFEEQFLNGKKIGNGKIVAAEFVNGGKTFQAVRYTDKDGISNYYTPDGRGMHKAFLRSPIEFARISSHFNLARKHPVLHVIRAHKGTDYAAAKGTPIRSTGNGKISFAGVKGGYGNTIVIQHGQGIDTLYAHMSSFAKGMRNGAKVRQGDVIGYVGATGLASGPHLHYEFHVNGQVRNPVTVPLPKTLELDRAELARFKQTSQSLVAQLENYKPATRVAKTQQAQNSN